MSDLAHIKQQLQRFGLSDGQAEIYLLLVGHQELRIQEIAALTGIPRSSVYESLKKLYELGIAEEIVEDNYKKIRPYPIGVMRHGFDERISDLQRLVTDLDDIEQSIEVAAAKTSSGAASVRYYKGRSGARQLFWNSLKADDVMYIYSEWTRVRYVGIKYYENFVAESRKRGVREKVLVNPEPRVLDTIEKYILPGNSPTFRTRVEDIRVLDENIIKIKGETLIYGPVYAQAYLKNVEIHGFEIESQTFVNTQRSIFETLWDMGIPVTNYFSK
ncbi:MAG TPA: helix-turn-helix domain-containing protein [Candidatus Pristimantibacillus sp.]|jgi:sugar-specific transcriptional regulator TrmB|nr:helix-turn-helix domain-containing protein [Candidatus Pristimantibacillus sp.]